MVFTVFSSWDCLKHTSVIIVNFLLKSLMFALRTLKFEPLWDRGFSQLGFFFDWPSEFRTEAEEFRLRSRNSWCCQGVLALSRDTIARSWVRETVPLKFQPPVSGTPAVKMLLMRTKNRLPLEFFHKAISMAISWKWQNRTIYHKMQPRQLSEGSNCG